MSHCAPNAKRQPDIFREGRRFTYIGSTSCATMRLVGCGRRYFAKTSFNASFPRCHATIRNNQWEKQMLSVTWTSTETAAYLFDRRSGYFQHLLLRDGTSSALIPLYASPASSNPAHKAKKHDGPICGTPLNPNGTEKTLYDWYLIFTIKVNANDNWPN